MQSLQTNQISYLKLGSPELGQVLYKLTERGTTTIVIRKVDWVVRRSLPNISDLTQPMLDRAIHSENVDRNLVAKDARLYMPLITRRIDSTAVLQSQVQNLSGQVQALSVTNTHQAQQINILNVQLRERQAQETILEEQINLLRNTIDELQAQVAILPVLSNTINNLTAGLANSSNQIGELRQTIQEILNGIRQAG